MGIARLSSPVVVKGYRRAVPQMDVVPGPNMRHQRIFIMGAGSGYVYVGCRWGREGHTETLAVKLHSPTEKLLSQPGLCFVTFSM